MAAPVPGNDFAPTMEDTPVVIPVLLNDSDPDGDPLSYEWRDGSTILATGPTPTVTLGLGTHTLTLEVRDGKGGSSTDEVAITVLNSPPTAEAGGPYDKAVARRLREDIFAIGNTVDPAEAYRAFRGRDPGIAALMRKRGFPVPAEAKAGH